MRIAKGVGLKSLCMNRKSLRVLNIFRMGARGVTLYGATRYVSIVARLYKLLSSNFGTNEVVIPQTSRSWFRDGGIREGTTIVDYK